MDYMNLESIQTNITSYLEAFNKMREYCKEVEPTANQFNWRVILPTEFRPVGGYSSEKIRKDANYLYVTHAKLLDFGKARFLAKGYWDYDSFFKVSWQLQIPFDYFGWERGIITYPNGYDENDNPIGEAKHIPPCMKAQDRQYLKLGEISGWAMKAWALPDWWAKHQEIEFFMDDNLTLKEQYRKAVAEADKEVTAWQSALEDISKLQAIFSSQV